MSAALSAIAVSYRSCPISKELNRTTQGRLQVGDRAPDCTLGRSDGSPTRLYAELREPSFHLLGVVSGAGDRRDPVTVALLDEITRRYGDLVSCRVIVSSGGTMRAPVDRLTLIDADGSFQRRYDVVPGSLILLRRDGYLALVLSAPDKQTLLDGMRRWVLAPAAIDTSGRAVGAPSSEQQRDDTVAK